MKATEYFYWQMNTFVLLELMVHKVLLNFSLKVDRASTKVDRASTKF